MILRKFAFKLRAADGIRTRDKSLEGYCVTPTPLPHVGNQLASGQ